MPVVSTIAWVWIATTAVAVMIFAVAGILYIRAFSAFHAVLQRDYPDQLRNLAFGLNERQAYFGRNRTGQINLLITGIREIDTPDPYYRRLLIRARISALVSLVAFVLSFVALGFTFQALSMQ